MTPQIALVLGILLVAVVLFLTERLRVDLVALLALSALALTGLVTPAEAVSGFSNPAVITVWAMFILSGGLSRTGVAGVLGRYTLRLAGQGEIRLLVVIMLTAAGLSAFMNNVGVAALMLPVVMDLARRTGRAPSKLLMPLATGSLLGGLTTLIGTPPNILASDALRESGLQPFQFFDFTPVGIVLLLAGVAFMALAGRRLLPERDLVREFPNASRSAPGQAYDLRERLWMVQLPPASALVGKTLAESRIGSVLDLNVIGLHRAGQVRRAPGPHDVLQAGDRLLVVGRLDRLTGLHGREHLIVEPDSAPLDLLADSALEIAEVGLSPRSTLLGQTLAQIEFRRRFGVTVLAVWRDGAPKRTGLQNVALQLGDTLLVQGSQQGLVDLRKSPDFLVSGSEVSEVYRIHERLLVVRIPEDSTLAGQTLADSRLGEAYGLNVLGIKREAGPHLIVPAPADQLLAGDTLLVEGKPEELETLRSLQALQVDREASLDLQDLESEQIGLVEAVLSPHTSLAGRTLHQLHFREKFGVSVLAILREGRAYRSNLRNIPLKFGDALLLYGPRESLKVLGDEPDFLVLAEAIQEAPRMAKAPLAALIMAGVVLAALAGWLPIAIAGVAGASLIVLAGCLTMEEAYRSIDWRAVFLIAGMLPLGIAMDHSGAASYIAAGVVSLVGGLGVTVLLAALFILATLASQVMPNAVVVVLLAPIALDTTAHLGVSPHTMIMVVAIAASAAFLSPVGHPANLLIMGPGGYRFADFIRVGLPLTLVVLVVTLLILPVVWPPFP